METQNIDMGASNATTESTDSSISTTTQDSQDSTENGNQTIQNKDAAPTAKELAESDLDAIVKVKINGQEQKMTVKELMKVQQLEKASYEKMRQAAQVERQSQQLLQLALNNPEEFYRRFGKDPAELSEKMILKHYQQASMTPEQKRMMEMEERLSRYEQQEKMFEEQKRQQIESQKEAEMVQNLDREISEAWKTSGLPQTKHVLASIATHLLSNEKIREQEIKEYGQAFTKELTANEAAARVKREYGLQLKEFISKIDDKSLPEIIGEENAKRLRLLDLQRVTGQQNPITNQKMSSPSNEASERKAMSEVEYMEYWKNQGRR